ncbi:trypsin-like peptidase domain-containing protein [Alisedimentitalea sp. MJ-SS2]|uniref:trypsin-like peptidase domain-containing protein n=1 Tax=Aliisedimentitalea sp. MJ-SS2 TaxID=3049795 RepID=UPI0029126421|nr:trypsin-like peptidase domain-containing protein [Alisedimentitalea sp. MJ-SS2]MDU8929110.1 trypsin-like peptidase domain-containing protein [Alisedimentitalea sp. MJ-SS2]
MFLRLLSPLVFTLTLVLPFEGAAQDLVGFDSSSFGKIVLSKNQVAAGAQFEAAVGQYNNEFIETYSVNSIFRSFGRSVGRLDVLTDKGTFPCTAFIVSERHILTNHHCVPGILNAEDIGAEQIRAVGFVAGYVRPGVEEGAEFFQVIPIPVETSEELDYTVLEVIGNPSAKFGMLELSASEPSAGDPYWIIGHPLGEAQRISREKCRANSPALSGGSLLHTCDTLPGNSGSPVIDASLRRVVGLHYAGSERNSVNFAMPMKTILERSRVLVAAKQGGGQSAATTPSGGGNAGQCEMLYSEAKNIDDCDGYQVYLSRCPDHVFAPFAQTFVQRKCEASRQVQSTAAAPPAITGNDLTEALEICRDTNGDVAQQLDGCSLVIETTSDQVLIVEARLRRAEDYLNLGDPAEAWKDIQRLASMDVEDSGFQTAYFVLRAETLRDLDRYAEAVEFYDKALPEFDRAYVWNGRGLALLALDRRTKAAESFLKAAFAANTSIRDRALSQQELNKLGAVAPEFLLPEDIVANFYDMATDNGAGDATIGGLQSGNPYIHASLASLLKQDEERYHPYLEFDPIVDGQDALIRDVAVSWQLFGEGTEIETRVTAKFKNFDEEKVVVYYFKPSDELWKLANIKTRDWDLREMLEEAALVTEAPYHPCDEVAAHPSDPNAMASGLAFEKIDASNAIAQCEKAYAQYPNVLRFQYQLGRAFDRDKQWDLAFEYYRIAAEKGYPRAMASLGYLYEHGEGVAINLPKAARWYDAAASSGLPAFGEEAGLLFRKSEDHEAAFRNFRIAAQDGQKSAQFFYALYLDNGWATKRDRSLARIYYKKAAEQGSSAAMNNLSKLYEFGWGGARNYTLAGEYLFFAIQSGNEAALGNILRVPMPYSVETVQTVQRLLRAKGLYQSDIDGVVGRGTKAALLELAKK